MLIIYICKLTRIACSFCLCILAADSSLFDGLGSAFLHFSPHCLLHWQVLHTCSKWNKQYMHFDQNCTRNLLVHFVFRFEQTIFMFVSDLGNTPPTLALAQLSHRTSDHGVFYMLLGLLFPLYPVALLDFQEVAHNYFPCLVSSLSYPILFPLHR